MIVIYKISALIENGNGAIKLRMETFGQPEKARFFDILISLEFSADWY